jgi:hypothetical protein
LEVSVAVCRVGEKVAVSAGCVIAVGVFALAGCGSDVGGAGVAGGWQAARARITRIIKPNEQNLFPMHTFNRSIPYQT